MRKKTETTEPAAPKTRKKTVAAESASDPATSTRAKKPREPRLRAPANEVDPEPHLPSPPRPVRASKTKSKPEPKTTVEEKTPAPQSNAPAKPSRVKKKSEAGPAPVAAKTKKEATPAPELVALTAKKPARGRQPRKPSPSATNTEELPVPIWRPRQPLPKQDFREDAAEATSPAPRRSKGKRQGAELAKEVTAADALQRSTPRDRRRNRQEPTEPPVPEQLKTRETRRKPKPEAELPQPEVAPDPPKVREIVPIPPDAPQVVVKDGVGALVRNKRVYPPLFFFASAQDEHAAQVVFEEIQLATQNGVNLFTHLIELDVDFGSVDDAVSFAAWMVKKTVEINPDAQVLLRTVFVAPRGWESRYPRAKYLAEGGGIAEPSICDDAFWDTASECLRLFIQKLRLLDLKENILGVHLERGEWFFADGWGYDTSVAAYEKFREWTQFRYQNDVVALRAAWFDGNVQLQTLTVPEYRREHNAGEKFVRTGRKARRWVDYHLFLSDTTVERIGKLAHVAKKASEGYFLVGVSYGYTYEWSHPANGHLSLGKLLRNPEVDFIAGPPSYKNREAGGSAPFPGPIDSFLLNGKLYISEEDFKTPISGHVEPDDFNPVIKTPQALENVHWRGIGAALAHQSGVSWMDLWAHGWLRTPAIWQRGSKAVQALTQRLGAPAVEPEVVVFIDERSLAYLVDELAFNLLVQNVRESMLRSGLSVGFYLLSDLAHREKFPEAKLYIFMNAWDIRPEVRSAIKTRLQRDGNVLFWLYAAGLFDTGREALERVREVTGIALKPQPFASRAGTTMLNRKHPLCEALPERMISGGGELEPSYFAIPEDGHVLGEYSGTGLPSFVVKEFVHESEPEQNWQSVFLGEPFVTPGLFRALGQMAGAHVWNYQEDVLHVRPPFLTVHCTGAGNRTITLPDKWFAYDLISGNWVGTDSTHLNFYANDGQTFVFLVGTQMEIEDRLNGDPEKLLRMEEIPQREENTIHLDSVHFDVQIMKLDEWMEEGLAEDGSDEHFLTPMQIESELATLPPPVQNEERKRSSRSGKRGNNRGQKKPPNAVPAESGDISINVVFRKRE